MISVKPALSASPTWTGRRNSGDEEDADTRNTPSDESRPGKAASLSMAPCENAAGSAFRNPYHGLRRRGLTARLSRKVPPKANASDSALRELK